MLGELIVEVEAERSTMRVLSETELEDSQRGRGTAFGAEVEFTATYRGEMRPDGTMWGEGHEVYITPDGDVLSATVHGIGRWGADGALSWRGASYFRTSSEKLAHANGVVGVYETEQNLEGTSSRQKVWEWR